MAFKFEDEFQHARQTESWTKSFFFRAVTFAGGVPERFVENEIDLGRRLLAVAKNDFVVMSVIERRFLWALEKDLALLRGNKCSCGHHTNDVMQETLCDCGVNEHWKQCLVNEEGKQ
jgi:hypothetical protein